MTENTFFYFLKKFLTSVFCGANMILLKQNRKGDKKMKNQKFSVEYKDLFNGIVSIETMLPQELKYFLRDERNGEIQILEIDQTFDDWETMEVLYTLKK